MASFLYCSSYSYRDSCHSFRILKALAKSKGNIFAIASESEKQRERATTIAIAIVGRTITLVREQSDTVNEAKKIKSDNFTGVIEKTL